MCDKSVKHVSSGSSVCRVSQEGVECLKCALSVSSVYHEGVLGV